MPSWILEDDCLAPSAKLTVNYGGPNPFVICQKIRDTLRTVFEIESKDYWERDFRWDNSSEPRTFYMRACARKGIDARTELFVEVVMQGEQPSDPTKHGTVTVTINGRMKTEYELNSAFKQTPIYRGFLWIYNKFFYYDVRRDWLKKKCTDKLESTWRAVRSILNMPSP
jgi:hypothetical protein